MRPKIELTEFKERVRKTQESMKAEGIDVLLACGNEAEPQYVRYYSNYWPNFELAGVLIPQEGEPTLIIGPESETYAASVSKIPRIRRLLAFRESSEPEYPDAVLPTFEEVILEATGGVKPKKVGVGGRGIVSYVVYTALEQAVAAIGGAEIIKADHIINKLRACKSEAEVACLREAYRITQSAMVKVLDSIHVGMTEEQVRGIAVAQMYAEGAEGEAYPCWILTGEGSNLAIGRCRNKTIMAGDLVHIQIGARYQGYASTMGRAVVMGKATPEQRSLIEAGLAGQKAILETAAAGVNAKEVAKAHYEAIAAYGHEGDILYGPCHGTGLMEGEYPWIESNSDYLLEEGMTFCTCVYLGNEKMRAGIRIEDGFIVTKEGTESFSDYRREVIEITQ